MSRTRSSGRDPRGVSTGHLLRRTGVACTVLSAIAPLTGPAIAADPSQSAIEYNRDVRPILSEYCFACHGPDGAARKADLRLDRREAAIEAGAIVPGDTEQSELVNRIFSTEGGEVMPPPGAKKPLSPAQKELLRRRVASGAEYQPHWSLIAPKRPRPPASPAGCPTSARTWTSPAGA